MNKYLVVSLLFIIGFMADVVAQKSPDEYPYRTLYVIFPYDVFKADYPAGPPSNPKELGPQTTNLLKYCRINHFACIMFNNLQVYRPKDKVEHECKDLINGCCAWGILPDGWQDYFALFVKTAKKPVNAGGYGLKSIGAELRELSGDEFYGDNRCCISDIDAIIKAKMTEIFTIKTSAFEGPLDLLLSLVEKRKLFVNDVSLAQVTDDYITHVNKLGDYSLHKRELSP